jgi:hypothetical protein
MGIESGWFGTFAANAVQRFGSSDSTLRPFLTAGYANFFLPCEGAANLFDVGGGITAWSTRRVGVRIEGRDFVHPSEGAWWDHVLSLRVGITFQ